MIIMLKPAADLLPLGHIYTQNIITDYHQNRYSFKADKNLIFWGFLKIPVATIYFNGNNGKVSVNFIHIQNRRSVGKLASPTMYNLLTT